MDKTIFKYPIIIANFFKIEMPQNAKILSVGKQNNKAYIWAMINESEKLEDKIFCLMGTGHPSYEDEKNLHFIGTFQLEENNGSVFVGHLFEIIKK